MTVALRLGENPILKANKTTPWEADSVFNGCPIIEGKKIHLLYRAISSPQNIGGDKINVSSIGHAVSSDGIHFQDRKQFITPKFDWEKYGCEDPRVTRLEGKYYIFYTALSMYPFRAEGIRVGVVVTDDLKTIQEKRLVTPFNAKAMALFPERINGKIVAILSTHTDRPPVKIALAFFDSDEQIWSREYWERWHRKLDDHTVTLQRGSEDHVEVGAPPVKTKKGWLLIYSDIRDYHSGRPQFTVQAVLLDLKDPSKVIGRTEVPLLVPKEEYELRGKVPNIVFPSGAIVKRNKLYIYYGAADTVVGVATLNLGDLLKEMRIVQSHIAIAKRFHGNPIIIPDPNHAWEAKATFNPGTLLIQKKVHILYRAMSQDNTSVFGYATSPNGYMVDERLAEPVYVPRESFEQKLQPGGNSGCEDPRLTQIGSRIYACYTAFDGKNPPRGALSTISVSDFLARRWNWRKPILITPPGVDDKDVAIFPKKIGGRYAFLHRPHGTHIWIDFIEDLTFRRKRWLHGQPLFGPRRDGWETDKVGIASVPIATRSGWLLIYHARSQRSGKYRVGAALLDLKDPTHIHARTHDPILEPEAKYETEGQVANVVFPGGSVLIKNTLFLYYGGGDSVVGVATIKLSALLRALTSNT